MNLRTGSNILRQRARSLRDEIHPRLSLKAEVRCVVRVDKIE
jgi:hypothetical protein